jgi:carbon storage regulator
MNFLSIDLAFFDPTRTDLAARRRKRLRRATSSTTFHRKEAPMLILTRRPAETIYIGEEVTVTVLGVVGNQVRFGIEAPRSITIDRAEIHERKKRAALGNANVGSNGNVADGTESHPDDVNGNIDPLPPSHGVDGPMLKLRR